MVCGRIVVRAYLVVRNVGALQSSMQRTIPGCVSHSSRYSGVRCIHNGGSRHSVPRIVSCSSLDIHHGDVHLWWMPLRPPPVGNVGISYDACRDLLDPVDEVKRLDKAIQSQNTLSWWTEIGSLVARAYLRHVLSQYKGISSSPQEIEFVRNVYGKPELKEPRQTQIHFNVTHSHGIVGIAVSCGNAIGIDAEARARQTRKPDGEMKLAKRYFSKHEIDMLASLPPGEERQELFVQLWTLKESYVKALGRGIGASPGLQSFGFHLDTSTKYIDFFPNGGTEPSKVETPWSFTLLEPFPGYVGAVCSAPCTTMTMHVSPSLTHVCTSSSIRTGEYKSQHRRVPVPVLASSQRPTCNER